MPADKAARHAKPAARQGETSVSSVDDAKAFLYSRNASTARAMKQGQQPEAKAQQHMDAEDRRVKKLTEAVLYDFLPAALHVMCPHSDDPLQELNAEKCRAVASSAMCVSALLNAPPGFLEFLICVPWRKLSQLYPKSESIDKLISNLHVTDEERRKLVNTCVDPALTTIMVDFLYRDAHVESVPPMLQQNRTNPAKGLCNSKYGCSPGCLCKISLETVAALLDGATPLHCAALRGNPAQVDHLLFCGAEPSIRTTAGLLPIELVPVCEHCELAPAKYRCCNCMSQAEAEVWECRSDLARRLMARRSLLSIHVGLFTWLFMVLLSVLSVCGVWGWHVTIARSCVEQHVVTRRERRRQEARARAQAQMSRMRAEAQQGHIHLSIAKREYMAALGRPPDLATRSAEGLDPVLPALNEATAQHPPNLAPGIFDALGSVAGIASSSPRSGRAFDPATATPPPLPEPGGSPTVGAKSSNHPSDPTAVPSMSLQQPQSGSTAHSRDSAKQRGSGEGGSDLDMASDDSHHHHDPLPAPSTTGIISANLSTTSSCRSSTLACESLPLGTAALDLCNQALVGSGAAASAGSKGSLAPGTSPLPSTGSGVTVCGGICSLVKDPAGVAGLSSGALDSSSTGGSACEMAFRSFVVSVHSMQSLELQGATVPQVFAETVDIDDEDYQTHVLEDEQADLYCSWAESVLLKFRSCSCPSCTALAVQAVRMAHLQSARLYARVEQRRAQVPGRWHSVGQSLARAVYTHICLLLMTETQLSPTKASLWRSEQCLREWARLVAAGLAPGQREWEGPAGPDGSGGEAWTGVDLAKVDRLQQWTRHADSDLYLAEAMLGSSLGPSQSLSEALNLALSYSPSGVAYLARTPNAEMLQQLEQAITLAISPSPSVGLLARSMVQCSAAELAAAGRLRDAVHGLAAGTAGALLEAADAAEAFPRLAGKVQAARELHDHWLRRTEAESRLHTVVEAVRQYITARPLSVLHRDDKAHGQGSAAGHDMETSNSNGASESGAARGGAAQSSGSIGGAKTCNSDMSEWEQQIQLLEKAINEAKDANIGVSKAKRLLKEMQAQVDAAEAAAQLEAAMTKRQAGSGTLRMALTRAEAAAAALSGASATPALGELLLALVQGGRRRLEVERAAEQLHKAAQTCRSLSDLPRLEAAILNARKVGAEEVDGESYRQASDMRARLLEASRSRATLEAAVKALSRQLRPEDAEAVEKALADAAKWGEEGLLGPDIAKAKESLEQWKSQTASEARLARALREGSTTQSLARAIQEATNAGVKVQNARRVLKLMQALEAAMVPGPEGAAAQAAQLRSRIEAAEQAGVVSMLMVAARKALWRLSAAGAREALEAALKPHSERSLTQRTAALRAALGKVEAIIGVPLSAHVLGLPVSETDAAAAPVAPEGDATDNARKACSTAGSVTGEDGEEGGGGLLSRASSGRASSLATAASDLSSAADGSIVGDTAEDEAGMAAVLELAGRAWLLVEEDQREMAKLDAEKAAAERARKEQVEKAKQERLKQEQARQQKERADMLERERVAAEKREKAKADKAKVSVKVSGPRGATAASSEPPAAAALSGRYAAAAAASIKVASGADFAKNATTSKAGAAGDKGRRSGVVALQYVNGRQGPPPPPPAAASVNGEGMLVNGNSRKAGPPPPPPPPLMGTLVDGAPVPPPPPPPPKRPAGPTRAMDPSGSSAAPPPPSAALHASENGASSDVLNPASGANGSLPYDCLPADIYPTSEPTAGMPNGTAAGLGGAAAGVDQQDMLGMLLSSGSVMPAADIEQQLRRRRQQMLLDMHLDTAAARNVQCDLEQELRQLREVLAAGGQPPQHTRGDSVESLGELTVLDRDVLRALDLGGSSSGSSGANAAVAAPAGQPQPAAPAASKHSALLSAMDVNPPPVAAPCGMAQGAADSLAAMSPCVPTQVQAAWGVVGSSSGGRGRNGFGAAAAAALDQQHPSAWHPTHANTHGSRGSLPAADGGLIACTLDAASQRTGSSHFSSATSAEDLLAGPGMASGPALSDPTAAAVNLPSQGQLWRGQATGSGDPAADPTAAQWAAAAADAAFKPRLGLGFVDLGGASWGVDSPLLTKALVKAQPEPQQPTAFKELSSAWQQFSGCGPGDSTTSSARQSYLGPDADHGMHGQHHSSLLLPGPGLGLGLLNPPAAGHEAAAAAAGELWPWEQHSSLLIAKAAGAGGAQGKKQQVQLPESLMFPGSGPAAAAGMKAIEWPASEVLALAAAHPAGSRNSRMCRHFLAGYCRDGDRCKFMHSGTAAPGLQQQQQQALMGQQHGMLAGCGNGGEGYGGLGNGIGGFAFGAPGIQAFAGFDGFGAAGDGTATFGSTAGNALQHAPVVSSGTLRASASPFKTQQQLQQGCAKEHPALPEELTFSPGASPTRTPGTFWKN